MITRRTILAGLAAALLAPPASAEDHPSVVFMRQVAKDMLAAHRQGTVPAFLRVVQRHADIPDIAENALGKYSSSLQSYHSVAVTRRVLPPIWRVTSP